jgi:glutathione S-transferase
LAEIGTRFGDDKKTPWVQWVVTKGLAAFEKLLESTKGTYCVGDEVTLADFFLIPQLFTAARFEVDTSQWPLITEVHENLKKLEVYDVTHPNNQIDALK